MFKSRWRAAIWSLCILLTAYCAVPSADSVPKHEAHKVAHAQQQSPWAY